MAVDGQGADRRGVGPLVVGVISGAAHLVPGFFIVASGLVAPWWAVGLMTLVWIALTVLLVRMVQRRSWWTPVIPLLAAVLWVTTLTVGENTLGWTA